MLWGVCVGVVCCFMFLFQLSSAEIYSPLSRGLKRNESFLIAPPEQFQKSFKEFATNVFRNVELRSGPNDSLDDLATTAYLETLKSYIAGVIYGSVERSVSTQANTYTTPFNSALRLVGEDWPLFGVSMVGIRRLENVQKLLFSVISQGVEGDFVETGVWRGGTCIFARGILRAKHQLHRKVYVCDSFAGLPPGNPMFGRGDMNWEKFGYLPTPPDHVAFHFSMFNLLDHGVVFVQGYFNDSMPVFRHHLQITRSPISILRMDGDMYQSTIDVLYRLYDLVSVGGYVIIDDWLLPARKACDDFFKHHNHHPTIIPIDRASVYWMKHESVELKMEFYTNGQ